MKTILIAGVVGGIAGAIAVAGYLFFLKFSEEYHDTKPGPTACTLEAKVCPDGTAVGRTGPNCEFAVCPGEIE